MPTLLHRKLVLAICSLIPIVVVACSGDDDESASTSSELTFAAEAPPLQSFSFDTGLIPSGSPVQVSLKLAAGGMAKVVAVGTKLSSGAIVGKSGGGSFALDLHATMQGRLKIDTPLKKADEELPGLKNIDVPIAKSVTFDPFLLESDQNATVAAEIPETKLPPIPLGSVPGKLELTITKDSKVTSVLHGRCMLAVDGRASYLSEATTSGTLVLKGTILVELPAPLNTPVDIGTITVPIPESRIALDSKAVDAPGASNASQGSACPATSSSDGGTNNNNNNNNNNNGSADTGVGDSNDPQNSTTTYRGTLASSQSVQFGGGSFCSYAVALRDIDVTLGFRDTDGKVVSGKVTNRVEEALDGSCPFPAAAPSNQSFELVANNGSEVTFRGAPTNAPVATLSGTVIGGSFTLLTWHRTDVGTPLDWTVNARVPLTVEPK